MWNLEEKAHAYWDRCDSQREILVPVGHVIMWSVQRLLQEAKARDEQDKLMVSIGGQAPTDLVWEGSDTVTPDPAVHNTTSVFVHSSRKVIGQFRLIFSFHKVRVLSSKAQRNTVSPVVLYHSHACYKITMTEN